MVFLPSILFFNFEFSIKQQFNFFILFSALSLSLSFSLISFDSEILWVSDSRKTICWRKKTSSVLHITGRKHKCYRERESVCVSIELRKKEREREPFSVQCSHENAK